MESVLIVGAGFMGSGIAQVCAQSGYRVHLMDIESSALERALNGIQWSLGRLNNKGLLKEPPETILRRLSLEKDLSSATLAGWVIEAVFEAEDLKKQVFQELDRITSAEVPLASNTSCIPITRIAQVTHHPERVLGLHFFGPVPLMPLVEVVKGENTSVEVFERGVAFVQSLGKTPLRVYKDIPGFVVNRVLSAALRAAVYLVDQGIARPQDVDTGVRLGLGWNTGLLELADNAGLDTCLLVAKSLRALGEDMPPESNLLERMVAEGRLGRKVGKGFYHYNQDGKRLPWEASKK